MARPEWRYRLTIARRLLPVLVVLAALAPAPGLAAPMETHVRAEPARAPSGTASSAVALAWCGTDVSATDRRPDAVAARQIGVIYAFPAGGADRFASMATPIVTDLGTIDAWWRREDPARAPRFDLASFPGCATSLGRLDLARVPLQRGAEFYAPLTGRFARLTNELFGPPFAFASRFKKYLVYYDGPVEETDVCGTGGGPPTEGASFAIVYLRACLDDIGTGALQADVAVHELLHTLGAVPREAPNTCAESEGHVCDSETDIMFPSTRGDPLETATLDVGRNDYYGHSGAWFDVQDSGWLAHLDGPQFPLTVSTAGSTGPGRVESDLPGIQCPGVCSIVWDRGTPVTLTAVPGERTRFAGWTGDCSGADACSTVMDAARSVSARFVLQVRLVVQVLRRGGSGSVLSAPEGLECEDLCSADFDSGQVVRLRPVPDRGSRFLGWGGACAGRAACAVTADVEKTVTAAFGRGSFRLTVRLTGAGRVTSRPGGISCGRRCTALFRAGSTVRLSAVPEAGWRFAGWSGACRGRGACVVRATADRSVRATFLRG